MPIRPVAMMMTTMMMITAAEIPVITTGVTETTTTTMMKTTPVAAMTNRLRSRRLRALPVWFLLDQHTLFAALIDG